jgi:hypothetical protein
MAAQTDCEYNFTLDKEGKDWCVCNWHTCSDKCKDYQQRPLKEAKIRQIGVHDAE